MRSILFRVGDDHLVMVLARGGAQISWKKLRRHLSKNRITLATEAEVLRITGYAIGSVSPFGQHEAVRLCIDRGVLAEEEISIGSGWANTGIVMRSQDLLGALQGAELVDFSQGT